jgi:hypothetical protein
MVTVVPSGYVAVQIEVGVTAGPQLITLGVPVAEGAVSSQLEVLRPALKTVRVTRSADATVWSLQDPKVGRTGGVAVGSPGVYAA